MVPIAATAPLINITIRASDDDVCKTKCKYTLWDNNEMSALYYSVFVTAKNIHLVMAMVKAKLAAIKQSVRNWCS